MDYRQTLDYLYGLQRFGIKLGLENIRTLLARLGHPEAGYRTAHVAGTNGKGSACATLAAILGRGANRVGLYTSPHLHSFTERIRVDGEPIAEEEVVALTRLLRPLADDVPITFFEFTTALALLHFQRQKVDIAVLEVGMGGRLDATNVVMPQVTVITPVCFDHAEHLGADLAAIAAEKGGIIKSGVPLVLGRQEPAAEKVLTTIAAELQAPLLRLGRDFSVSTTAGGFSFRGLGLALEGLRPGLEGEHQHENLALALAAAALLRHQGEKVTPTSLRDGVAAVRWPGRLEWWDDQRQILLDGAHNEGGARVLAAYLAQRVSAGVRWVVGLKGDKRPADILGPILPRVCALYGTEPPVETSIPATTLVAAGMAAGVPSRAFATPQEAFAAALADCRQGEIVLVAGSLYLVAAARQFLMDLQRSRA